jgi:hypothetical protein
LNYKNIQFKKIISVQRSFEKEKHEVIERNTTIRVTLSITPDCNCVFLLSQAKDGFQLVSDCVNMIEIDPFLDEEIVKKEKYLPSLDKLYCLEYSKDSLLSNPD